MYEDKIWFNQSIMNHKDKEFTKNGVLDISINNSTEDFKAFSSTAINLSISNDQIRKIQYLNYQNISDLIIALDQIIRDEAGIYSAYNTQGAEIIKKYTSDKTLRLTFKQSKSNQEKLCIISIINNESDFARVAITFDLVLIVTKLLKSFINDYINININFISRCISTESLNQLKNVRDSIKVLPGFFGSLNVTNTNTTPQVIMEESSIDSTMSEKVLDELNDFLGKDMSNITIPEIEKLKDVKEEKPKIENNEFISKFLRSDLSVLENIITSTSIKENPFISIVENIEGELQKELLPEISEDDTKSISYISKRTYLGIFKGYTESGQSVPSSVPILKYKIDSSKITETNRSISLDLLLIMVYFKNLRDKLEMRESNSIKNKSILYIGFRLFLDPLLFTFISSIEPDIIKSLIKDKFNKYSKNNFFDIYTKLLDSYGLEEISERQILESIDNLIKGIIYKTHVIETDHTTMFERSLVKIPYENKLTEEQIVNEVVPFELFVLFNPDKSNEYLESHPTISPEVIEYIIGKNIDSSTEKKTKDKKSLIEKTCQFYNSDIPVSHQEEFHNYIKVLKKENFKKEGLTFDINELGDNILKIIYVWNNSDKTETHAEFSLKVEGCIVDRNTILSNLENKVNIEPEQDWSSALQ